MQVAGNKRTPERRDRFCGKRRFIISYHLQRKP